MLWGDLAGLSDVPRGLGAMRRAGDASSVDGGELEGAQKGVSEGGQIGRSACLAWSYGHVAGCVRAWRVQGECTHCPQPDGTKKISMEAR